MADASDQRVGVKGEAAGQIFGTDFHPAQGRRIRSKPARKIRRLLSRQANEPNKVWRGHSFDRRTTGADPLREPNIVRSLFMPR